MPLFGTLSSMPLPDLLQWLGSARKTGTLQVERNRVHKWILLNEGRIVGCSSDDPPERLGHFLLSRGKITEDQLRIALAAQDGSDKYLGKIFIEMGALTPEDLSAHLEAKAEETIYSVFDWDDAVFRFHEQIAENDAIFSVDLRVEDVLLRGMKRYDDLQRIREVLHDRGMVLSHTGLKPPQEVFNNKMACALFEAIDGERTVAEILLHVHGSEYLVTKFLFELLRNGFLEITATKEVPQHLVEPPTELVDETVPEVDQPRDASFTVHGNVVAHPAAQVAVESEVATTPEVEVASAPADLNLDMPEELCEPSDLEPVEQSESYQFEKRLARAQILMGEGEFDQALGLLDGLYQQDPNNDSLRRMTAEAEAAFIEKAYRHYVPPNKVPYLLKDTADLEAQKLTPSEFFLISRLDGSWDVRSIIQIAPIREVEALRTLKHLREKGVIDLREPEEEGE